MIDHLMLGLEEHDDSDEVRSLEEAVQRYEQNKDRLMEMARDFALRVQHHQR